MDSADIFDPGKRGSLEKYTHHGQVGAPGGGPHVSLWMLVKDGVVIDARYETHGCMVAMACAGVTVGILKGRSTDKALLLEAKDIDLILGGIPEGKREYADMCVSALRSALGE
jgi:NifU-like protein involved in Fe-S cluster formation